MTAYTLGMDNPLAAPANRTSAMSLPADVPIDDTNI